MQTALRDIVTRRSRGRKRRHPRDGGAHGPAVLRERGPTTLMDPASNQKVLATTTALVRLGADWRFRTELVRPRARRRRRHQGDVFLRGSGDPTVTRADLDERWRQLARARGARRIDGGVVADPRRIGSDEAAVDDERPRAEPGPRRHGRGSAARLAARAAGRQPRPHVDPRAARRLVGWPAEVTTAPTASRS